MISQLTALAILTLVGYGCFGFVAQGLSIFFSLIGVQLLDDLTLIIHDF
jgi:hypothetical protein